MNYMNGKTVVLAFLIGLGLVPLSTKDAHATCVEEPHIGSICFTATSFCPRDYLPAEGQLLAITQYTALFSFLGTIYGGDGRMTFGLPDLRGTFPVGVGQPKRDTNGTGVKQGARIFVPRTSSENEERATGLGLVACIAVDGLFPKRPPN